jgi:hypothetical protein
MKDRPEHKLLLACARYPVVENRILECLRAPLDWEYLLDRADIHRMTSMLYSQLHTLASNQVPPTVLNRLRTHYLSESANNLLLTNELLRILDLFNKERIAAIPFKGPILGHMLYENPVLRESGDLDILIRQEDVFKSLNVLTQLGYPAIPEYSAYIQSRILRHDLHYSLENERTEVEIHWKFTPEYFHLPFPMNRAWDRADSLPFNGHNVSILSPGDLLMALCIHGCKHGWQRLAWLGDLARLLHRSGDLSWDPIFREYDHRDFRRILCVSLLLVNDLLDTQIQAEILEKAKRDKATIALVRTIQSTRFENRGNLHEKVFSFRFKSTLVSRTRSIFSYITLPLVADYQTSLPRFLYPFYRPLALCSRFFVSVRHRKPMA